MSDHKDHENPLTALWVSMSGASAGDHHETPPGIDAKSEKVGHEPDKFDVRSIVYVPIAVVLVLALTYTLVQVAIHQLIAPSTDTVTPQPSLNERFARISYENAMDIKNEDNPAQNLPAVPQPRLEHLQQTNTLRPGQEKEDPAYMTSNRPLPTGNSPKIYPQDLLPQNYIDPATNSRPLISYQWVKPNETAQIPIADAMKLLIEKKKLPIRKDAEVPATISAEKSKLSNGGLGGSQTKKGHDHDHDHK